MPRHASALSVGRNGQPTIELIGRRIRMVMGRTPDAPVPEPAAPPRPPEIEFIAYAEDCLLAGRIRLDSARLSDLLNAHDEFELVDVRVESLTGDRAVEVRDVVVARDELLVVHAVGPRGEREQRIRTRQHPLALGLGPYEVRGYLHALPGVDPISSFRHRKVMVPLTDATIQYEAATGTERRTASVVVVNRHQVDWVVEAHDDHIEMPDIAVVRPDRGVLAKDFTGSI
jgi:hypothetical protein